MYSERIWVFVKYIFRWVGINKRLYVIVVEFDRLMRA